MKPALRFPCLRDMRSFLHQAWFCRSFRFLVLPGILVFLAPATISTAAEKEDRIEQTVEPLEAEGWKRDLVFMPVPVLDPTIGTGLGLATMILYSLDENSPKSSTMLGGLYTDSGTWGVGIGQKTHLAGDRYRLNGMAGYFNLNTDFYGIGKEAGDNGLSVPINQHFTAVLPEFLVQTWPDLYLGARYSLIKVITKSDLSGLPSLSNQPEIQDDFQFVSSGPGFVLEYDTRDHTHTPETGTLVEFHLDFPLKALGSDQSYTKADLAYNRYLSMTETGVLALRATVCGVGGDAPFWDLCLFGSQSDLRGYVGGRYRDEFMLTAQAEYRWNFYKRFGLVAFGGAGAVAPSVGELGTASLLPSIGVGLRFMASVENRVNVGIDFAVGKDSDAFYILIGEAF